MGVLTSAEEELKAVVFRNQVETTKWIGRILDTQGETLCGNDLEKLASLLTVQAAIKDALERYNNS